MITKLTSIRFGDVEKIAATLCPKNLVNCFREENKHDSSGVAYRCESKDVVIGYLPDLKTLGGYYRDANTEQERARIKEWGTSVKACREQFKLDFENNGLEEWLGQVADILYHNEKTGDWLEFIDYRDQEGFKLKQIAVGFDCVEVF